MHRRRRDRQGPVSHLSDIHHLSKPLKYQSISVVGIRQLEKLPAVFDQQPAAERRVESLFVGNLDGDRDRAGPKDWHGELKECSSSVEQALNQLLNLVSSNLLVLHIHRVEVYRPSLFPEADLPVLAELVVQGSFKLSQPHDQRSLSLIGIKVALEIMPATPEAGPEAVYLPGTPSDKGKSWLHGGPLGRAMEGYLVSAFDDGWTENYMPIEVAKEEWFMTGK
ncbi:hypothetical protein C8J57DRAFT_1229796 [Mycena rebaudengoi]|nr:hypothetical protein C8J57DRAFT_1229796 [Mycena rebaudengoi]